MHVHCLPVTLTVKMSQENKTYRSKRRVPAYEQTEIEATACKYNKLGQTTPKTR